MAPVRTEVPVPPARVWDVLADGWTYASWVVGASHIRSVDPGWPAVGTRIHHSVGVWPAVIQDATEVVAADPGRSIDLEARVWPAGTAHVRLELLDHGDRTTITMTEQPRRGPLALVPRFLVDALLIPRNRETLSRLSDLAAAR
ncbi:SRPBCC family protein [Actinokineospora globicatena]|uniref:Polyketide cyclase n=1 Tax=Actinokineospora globicatena TaxID=103729 RepID=A0A9W6V899_9PSEU|nr:SRPBCC family protein [Actinokineospora globicatena]MCP2304497.1 Polyketide cyclase / dehydrase and lipid transport [Actinokineospora globicatena]GLW78135.1 polyketide cyclase [Actinokineospora globicatena]GLW85199.1 polyketide cyclase [Actinokineospora globicatena]GLW90739.1 polyketide cyclase [Actinokineospora globicatena]